MKLLIFGSGVIGSFYALYFLKAGYQVTMYARNNRFHQLLSNGLVYQERKTIKKLNVNVIDTLRDNDIYDFIFVTVKSDQIYDALRQLKNNRSKTLVTMVNTVDTYQTWENICGYNRILPAFPGAGGSIDEEGILRAYLTPSYIQKTTFGELHSKKSQRLNILKDIFKTSRIPYDIVDNMHLWQICHLALVVPLANVYYAVEKLKYTGYNYSTLSNAVDELKYNLSQVQSIYNRLLPKKMYYILYLPKIFVIFVLFILYNSSFGNRFMYPHSIKARKEMKYLENRLHYLFNENRSLIDN